MKGYHDLYLKCDVLLLANVFKNLEIMAQQIMGYIYYLSAPGLSWDAMLKMTKIEAELIPDPACIYSLRKVHDVEFLIFLIDTTKPTINI